MKKNLILIVTGVILIAFSPTTKQVNEEPGPTRISLQTTYGEIVIELSDKTPLHRDNFVKLVKEGTYDSLLFHRVIQGFVVQGGDPNSKTSSPTDTLGSGDLGYTVPAEFDSTLFHRRGAVGAARDGNPERASSAIQFYIVQASKPVPDSMLTVAEGRINGWLKDHYALKAPENKLWYDSVSQLMADENYEAYRALSDTLDKIRESFTDFESYTIPDAHREIYQTESGVPHLDQNYTVFGQVISGMAVVDSIATQEVNDMNRPIEDIRILSASVIEK